MADAQLLSLKTSPIAQTLNEGSSLQKMVYSVRGSLPQVSKNKYSITKSAGASNVNFGSNNVKFDLNKYGIMEQMVLKVTINVDDDDTAKAYHPSTGFGFVLVKEARLQTHNRTIQTLTPQYQMSKLMDMEEGLKKVVREAINWDTTATTTATDGSAPIEVVTYVPLQFSFAKHMSSNIDTQFSESLQLSLDFESRVNCFDPSTGEPDTSVFTAVELCVYYRNMDAEIYRSLQDKQYNIADNKALNYIWEDVFTESSGTSTSTSDGAECAEVSINLNCRNLVKRISILAVGDSKSNGLEGSEITQVQFWGNGKKIHDFTGRELVLVNALQSGLGAYSASLSANNVGGFSAGDSNEHLYVLDFSYANDQDYYSGGISLKGISNPQLRLKAINSGGTSQTITFKVECEHFNICSINPMDGRWAVSSNL